MGEEASYNVGTRSCAGATVPATILVCSLRSFRRAVFTLVFMLSGEPVGAFEKEGDESRCDAEGTTLNDSHGKSSIPTSKCLKVQMITQV